MDPLSKQIHTQPLGGGIEGRTGESQGLGRIGNTESTGLEGLQQEAALEGSGRLFPGTGLEHRGVQFGEVARLQDAVLATQDGAFKGVEQLPHIPRPGQP